MSHLELAKCREIPDLFINQLKIGKMYGLLGM